MCKKHNPEWIYPVRSEVPQDKRIDFIVAVLGRPTDYVVCTECGMIAHKIKSRRGGFRWHTNSLEERRRDILEEAGKVWDEIGVPRPEFITRHLK